MSRSCLALGWKFITYRDSLSYLDSTHPDSTSERRVIVHVTMAHRSNFNKQQPSPSASERQEVEDSSLLVFGSLALSFDQAAFIRVRQTVTENDENTWLRNNVVERLAATCATARSAFGGQNGGDVVDAATWEVARRDFAELAEAFRTPTRPLGVPFPLSNALLIPLVVIDQLTQYAAFVRPQHQQEHGHNEQYEEEERQNHEQQEKHGTSRSAWLSGNVETLGLCTGLLSAFAAAAAHNWDEFRKYGAAAVRIGMLVGVVIDSQARASGAGKQPRSLSVAWGSSIARDELTTILNEYPEVHVPFLNPPFTPGNPNC